MPTTTKWEFHHLTRKKYGPMEDTQVLENEVFQKLPWADEGYKTNLTIHQCGKEDHTMQNTALSVLYYLTSAA